MSDVGAYEAKTRLSELLTRVESGERITITRHGKAIAQLVPAPGAPDRTAADAIRGLFELRAAHKLGSDLSVHDLIDEGRKR